MDIHYALPALTMGLSVGYKAMAVSSGFIVPAVLMACGAGGSFWFHKNLPRQVTIKAIAPQLVAAGQGQGSSTKSAASSSSPPPIGILRVKGDASAGLPPFTVFYPADAEALSPASPTTSPHLPEEDGRYAEGVSRYASLPPFLLRSLNSHIVEAIPNGPILSPDSSSSDSQQQGKKKKSGSDSDFDVVVFSHGLAGHQSMYSTFCLELVANSLTFRSQDSKKKPVIAIALQHCDGSSSFSPVSIGDPFADNNSIGGGKSKALKLHPQGGLMYQPEPKGMEEGTKFRRKQLDLRKDELSAVLTFVKNGELAARLQATSSSPVAVGKDSNIHLIGHSFGAAGVIWATLNAQFRANFPTVGSVCIFDPWMYPIHSKILSLQKELKTSGKPIAGETALPPLRVIDSDQFDMWTGNKEQGADLITYWDSMRLKSKGSNKATVRTVSPKTDHMSLSDIVFFAKLTIKKYTDRSKLEVRISEWAGAALDFAQSTQKKVE